MEEDICQVSRITMLVVARVAAMGREVEEGPREGDLHKQLKRLPIKWHLDPLSARKLTSLQTLRLLRLQTTYRLLPWYRTLSLP